MSFTLEVPENVDAAVAALARGAPGEVVALAGGTDLLLDIDLGRTAPTRVVSLRRLPWRSVDRRDGRLRIGSLLPLRTLEKEPGLAAELPALYEAVRAVGSVALRTRATMGGNVVRGAPASDLLPVLLALDAVVHVVGPAGPRSVPLTEFLRTPRRPALGRAELVEAVSVPAAAPSAYAWQRVRPANDISQVGVAVGRPVPGGPWRVALGGIAPVPARIPSAEAPLTEARPSDGAIRAAADAAARDAPFVGERRATPEYRRLVVRVLARRALERAREPRSSTGASP